MLTAIALGLTVALRAEAEYNDCGGETTMKDKLCCAHGKHLELVGREAEGNDAVEESEGSRNDERPPDTLLYVPPSATAMEQAVRHAPRLQRYHPRTHDCIAYLKTFFELAAAPQYVGLFQAAGVRTANLSHNGPQRVPQGESILLQIE